MRNRNIAIAGAAAVVMAGLATSPVATAAPNALHANAAAIAAYWTPARMAAAIPRDIVVDARGNSFIADGNGTLRPYGVHPIVLVQSKGKPGGTGSLSNVVWKKGGTVQHATGRLYFDMGGIDYVCSGSTVIDDGAINTSTILTAAHCVYDDVTNAFASEVMFIPDLASGGLRTSSSCLDGYPHGCYMPAYGMVSSHWSDTDWPNNIPFDFGFYVVPNDAGHHEGAGSSDLEDLGALDITWDNGAATAGGSVTDAIGYSYKFDPQLMYCEQGLGFITGTYSSGDYTNFWLSMCKLSGGSSGGPWMAASTTGDGPVFSLNSWGYQGKPGMAGPDLQDGDAECVFAAATATPSLNDDGGQRVTCAD